MNSATTRKSALPLLHLFFASLLLVVLASIATLIDWEVYKINNDGTQYLSTARNVLDGNGFSTDTLAFGPHFQERIPGPQTVWPPGFPGLIALGATFTGDVETSALVINVIAHLFGSLFIVLVLMRSGVSAFWSLVAGLVYYLTYIQWRFVDGLLSEPLFATIIVASLLALPNIRRSSTWSYLFCGLLLAGSLAIRHSAVIYIAGVGIGVFLLLLMQLFRGAETFKGLVLKCLFLGGPGVLLFVAITIRIRLVTDSALKVSGANTPESLYFFLSKVFSELGWFFGFYSSGAPLTSVIGQILCIVFMSVIFIWAFMCLCRWYKYDKSRKKMVAKTNLTEHGAVTGNTDTTGFSDNFDKSSFSEYRTVLATVVIIHSVLFFVYFGYCAMTEYPLKFQRRYFFQVYSGLYLLFVIILFAGSRGSLSKTVAWPGGVFNRVNASLGFVAVLLFAIAQSHAFVGTGIPEQRNSEVMRMMDFPIARESGETTSLRKLVDSCFQTDTRSAVENDETKRDQGVIWSGQGQFLHQLLGVPTIALANRYQEDAIDFDDLERQIAAYNIRMIVLVPDWSHESEWKLPSIIEWAANKNLPIETIAGYSPDLSRKTHAIFVDSACAVAD